jgi:hypothetical protein
VDVRNMIEIAASPVSAGYARGGIPSDDARGQASQCGEAAKHTYRQGRLRRLRPAQNVADDPVLDQHLNALRKPRRPLAAALHGAEIIQRDSTPAQARHQ